MATYIQGVTDYIPQLQPFQPDYNFLANILQTRQSRYDTAHTQLNKMYGTLLYSPMLRDDNIQARDQFFKNIDQDIKKMSGLDLSLQQNVDAANNVFKSIYDNKNIVKDMTYTKQYKNNLENAENYRNCLDQEQCGGSYWEPGVNYLHYKAEEFKNASPEEAMNMQAPSYVPFVNITEKAVKYVEELKKSGFGITSVGWSKDGRYIITTKDGKNLELPLENLFQNQFGNDPKIQDMYEVMAYVQRKNYISNNLDQFGGDKNAAEDAYVNSITDYINQYKEKAAEALTNASSSLDKKGAIEQAIRKEGTTQDGDLAKAWMDNAVNYDQKMKNALFHDQTAKIATAIETNDGNRNAKIKYVDSLIARTLMNNDFKKAAIAVSSLTGEQKVEADPYAKSYYDFSLDMTKMAQSHKYSMEEDVFKAKLEMLKDEAKAELKARGPATSGLNSGRFVEGLPGTSATTENTDEALESYAYVEQQNSDLINYAKAYTDKSTNYYLSIANSSSASIQEINTAKAALKMMYGNSYDVASNTFKKNGATVDYSALTTSNPLTYYNNAVGVRKDKTYSALYSKFYSNNLDQIESQYSNSKQLVDISSKVFRKNNLNVQAWALQSGAVDEDMTAQFKALFTPDGDLRSKSQYVEMLTKAGFTPDGASDAYDESFNTYKATYNSGSSMGTDKSDPTKRVPIVEAIFDANKSFGMFAEGKTAGGGVQYAFDAASPAAFGTRGLLTFAEDAMLSPQALYSTKIVEAAGDATNSNDTYKTALNAVINDIKTGAYDVNDKDRPFGKVTYLDLGLSNPNIKAIHIDFSQSYLNKYRGTSDDPSWGADQDIAANGITVYVPKENLDNDFTKSFKLQTYDILLEHQPVSLEKDNGGKIVVSKNDNGTYNVTAELYDYSSGKRQVKYASNVLSADIGGQNLVMGYQKVLDNIDKYNTNIIHNIPVDKVFDPSQLSYSPTSIFDQGGGQDAGGALDQLMNQ